MKLLPVNVNTIATSLLKIVTLDNSIKEKHSAPPIEHTYKKTIEAMKENQKENQITGSKIDVYG